MPGARASHAHVVTAPGLLVCRPSEEPIGVAFMAVIVEFMMRVLIDDFRRQVEITVLVDDLGWGRHRHIVIVSRVEHWHMNHLVDDLLFFRAASALERTAFFLVPFSPKVFPVVVAIIAIEHVRVARGRTGAKNTTQGCKAATAARQLRLPNTKDGNGIPCKISPPPSHRRRVLLPSIA